MDLVADFNGDEYEYYKEQGLYPILSDANRLTYQNKTATLIFKGYIANEEIVTETYEVGAVWLMLINRLISQLKRI